MLSRPTNTTLSFLAAACLLATTVAANENDSLRWPSWRGSDSSGGTATGEYAARWNRADNIEWQTELPGVGRSTPIVWGERIILTAPADGEDTVLAFDWSGQRQWQTKIGAERAGKHGNGSGSCPSATTDGKYLFVYFRSGNLAGLDLGGKILWQTNLQKRFGEDTLWWDLGTSPVLTEKHVVVAVVQGGDSYLAAFAKATGDLAWKVTRKYDCPVEGDHAYTTPTVLRDGDRETIVVWGAAHLTGHDAASGKVVWSCGGFNPERRRNWVAVASAVVTDDVAVVPYGRGDWLAGVKLGGSGDVSETHRLWTRQGIGSFVPTPAARDGLVFVLGDRGELTAIDEKTGVTRWDHKLPKHRAKYYASPVLAGDKLYATREDGVIFTGRLTGSGFEPLGECDMGEKVIASPVPVGGRVLVRGEKHLFCVAAPRSTRSTSRIR